MAGLPPSRLASESLSKSKQPEIFPLHGRRLREHRPRDSSENAAHSAACAAAVCCVSGTGMTIGRSTYLSGWTAASPKAMSADTASCSSAHHDATKVACGPV
eukprot:TRINITY_DN20149_c0_g1_i1.p2 TRINITY_DN20149_c0_g1~~TRINITY_DN20149_c0_g1_i1.p2  ORF type:complete len:102 (+),score=2.25 TRINITY_DN20149_c0_g1_i1:147-452(+)